MRTRTATTLRQLCALTLAATAVAANTVALPAAAKPDRQTVVAGKARFQVLSPTLIRTEYAGDGRFEDAATFNAVGRDAFATTPFTSKISHGVLTIRTSATTLTYKLDSGPFDAGNLGVHLNAGPAAIAAAPWHRLTCAVGELCEAEDLTADGLGTATDHAGYTGGGFLAGFETTGAQATADVNATEAGAYTLTARYANGTGGDGKHEVRTLSLSVDGGPAQSLSFAPTDSWDAWGLASAPITLGAGHHVLRISRTATDSGNLNVDSFAILKSGDYPPAAARAYGDCAFGVSCEAEAGLPGGTAKLASDHPAYAGRGFIAELNDGSSLTQRIVNVPASGTYQLSFRYANGTGGDGQHLPRTATVAAAGVTRTASFPTTADWDTWGTTSVQVDLKTGTNEVVLSCPGTTSCHVNLDTIAATSTGVPAPQPHLALGGYRRGLDGVNGDNALPATTEGLLHQDGWYLLDDTTSALYDSRTRHVTQRPEHGSNPYQDGYLFAYGHNYKAGLGDLATLTGPPELLPRWAYGVWYSEYFDRTAADYRDTILPKFRANGVPLDVLVTDTDFKAPDTWNGWEFDKKKFPDPAAFFAWSKSAGLHNNLNIHPSIMGSDPQFAQAQATAKGKLTKSGCGTDCYVFDWGDPDQLKAYVDLHREMMAQGNDFWWLDWCCDSSRSSLSGVNPDAWINQQYADLATPAIGRGFAISRAYGSLQAGGYGGPIGLATGPWADKRSTLHFTGDTSSTWGTLRMEVGATPAESAATGMSAISHDIGGHNDTTGLPGSELYSSGGQQHRTAKLPDDMYARWVQLGTFQPIDRLHSNHSDRLPWQYGTAAAQSATRFLNLRENLVPYTYTLAQQAATTGVPVVRPTYLEYPEEPAAYTAAGGEYFYGPDVLVAPVTTPGTQTSTSVWFPPGQWTDYFTGKTYAGGTTQQVTSELDTMPVFLRAGGIMTTRTANVTNDVQNPLTKVTATVATGNKGSFTLYEDNGSTTNKSQSATTKLTYRDRTLTIAPTQGRFPGRMKARDWTVKFLGVQAAPKRVSADGHRLDNWTWAKPTQTLTVTIRTHPSRSPLQVSF